MDLYLELARDPTSRLHLRAGRRAPEQITSFITVALAKMQIDPVEWLCGNTGGISAAPGTYVAALVADIRRWVLEPYLWDGDRLCGIPHRNGYLYGVLHTTDTPHSHYYHQFPASCYYSMGLLHRVGAPARIDTHGYGRGLDAYYYQHGREHRENRPTFVAASWLNYSSDMSYTKIAPTVPFIYFRDIYVALDSRSDVFINTGSHLVNKKCQLDITKTSITIRYGAAIASIPSEAFATLCEGFEAALRSDYFSNLCTEEYARTLAEIAAN